MALNKNHEFEELNGIKCGIVEKDVTAQRVEFLKNLLEINGFKVIVVPSPPPKTATVVKEPMEGLEPLMGLSTPETFTVGVTDYTFNSTNAIFGRSLKTNTGHIVTLAYWLQQETVAHDEIPYYER